MKPSYPHRVFVYGTLKRGQFREEILLPPDAIYCGTATLQGYSCHTVNKTRFPAILPSAGTKVDGEVYGVTDATLAFLDRMEQAIRKDGLYRREVVRFQQHGNCYLYVWNRAPEELDPTHWQNWTSEEALGIDPITGRKIIAN